MKRNSLEKWWMPMDDVWVCVSRVSGFVRPLRIQCTPPVLHIVCISCSEFRFSSEKSWKIFILSRVHSEFHNNNNFWRFEMTTVFLAQKTNIYRHRLSCYEWGIVNHFLCFRLWFVAFDSLQHTASASERYNLFSTHHSLLSRSWFMQHVLHRDSNRHSSTSSTSYVAGAKRKCLLLIFVKFLIFRLSLRLAECEKTMNACDILEEIIFHR